MAEESTPEASVQKSKQNRLFDFIFDTVLFSGIFYFSKYDSLEFSKRLFTSLLTGAVVASLTLLIRYMIQPRLDIWKEARRKRRREAK